jgi:hypothetical protein
VPIRPGPTRDSRRRLPAGLSHLVGRTLNLNRFILGDTRFLLYIRDQHTVCVMFTEPLDRHRRCGGAARWKSRTNPDKTLTDYTARAARFNVARTMRGAVREAVTVDLHRKACQDAPAFRHGEEWQAEKR